MKKTSTAIVLPLLMAFSVGVIAQSGPSVLFPEPLHTVREIEDPISGRTNVVEEFYSGNQVVSVSGEHVAIADYAEGTLTEIDRGAGTYSIATFEAIAEARRSLGGARPQTDSDPEQPLKILAPQKIAGRVAETFALEFSDGELRRVEVSLSSEMNLSSEAMEVIAGAAFPNEPSRASRAMIALARRPGDGARTAAATGGGFALPLKQVLEFEVDGERLRLENRVIAIDKDLPPAEMLAIPAHATRVEPHLIRTRRLAEELDQLPGARENASP